MANPQSAEHELNARLLRFRSRPGSEEPGALAAALLTAERYADARSVAVAAQAGGRLDPALLLIEGRAWMAEGELTRALDRFLSAIGVEPTAAEPYRWLGRALMLRGDPLRAERAFAQSLELAPDSDDTCAELAQAQDAVARARKRLTEEAVSGADIGGVPPVQVEMVDEPPAAEGAGVRTDRSESALQAISVVPASVRDDEDAAEVPEVASAVGMSTPQIRAAPAAEPLIAGAQSFATVPALTDPTEHDAGSPAAEDLEPVEDDAGRGPPRDASVHGAGQTREELRASGGQPAPQQPSAGVFASVDGPGVAARDAQAARTAPVVALHGESRPSLPTWAVREGWSEGMLSKRRRLRNDTKLELPPPPPRLESFDGPSEHLPVDASAEAGNAATGDPTPQEPAELWLDAEELSDQEYTPPFTSSGLQSAAALVASESVVPPGPAAAGGTSSAADTPRGARSSGAPMPPPPPPEALRAKRSSLPPVPPRLRQASVSSVPPPAAVGVAGGGAHAGDLEGAATSHLSAPSDESGHTPEPTTWISRPPSGPTVTSAAAQTGPTAEDKAPADVHVLREPPASENAPVAEPSGAASRRSTKNMTAPWHATFFPETDPPPVAQELDATDLAGEASEPTVIGPPPWDVPADITPVHLMVDQAPPPLGKASADQAGDDPHSVSTDELTPVRYAGVAHRETKSQVPSGQEEGFQGIEVPPDDHALIEKAPFEDPARAVLETAAREVFREADPEQDSADPEDKPFSEAPPTSSGVRPAGAEAEGHPPPSGVRPSATHSGRSFSSSTPHGVFRDPKWARVRGTEGRGAGEAAATSQHAEREATTSANVATRSERGDTKTSGPAPQAGPRIGAVSEPPRALVGAQKRKTRTTEDRADPRLILSLNPVEAAVASAARPRPGMPAWLFAAAVGLVCMGIGYWLVRSQVDAKAFAGVVSTVRRWIGAADSGALQRDAPIGSGEAIVAVQAPPPAADSLLLQDQDGPDMHRPDMHRRDSDTEGKVTPAPIKAKGKHTAISETAAVAEVERLLDDQKLEAAQAVLQALPNAVRLSQPCRRAEARLYIELGREDRALALLEAMRGDGESDVRTLSLIAEALYGKGNVNSAAGVFDEALEADPDDLAALLGRAEVHLRAGRPRDALPLLKRAESQLLAGRGQSTHEVRWLSLMGHAYLQRGASGDRNRAHEVLQQAVALPHAPAEAHFWLGESLGGRHTFEAADAYRTYLELAPHGRYADRARRALGPLH